MKRVAIILEGLTFKIEIKMVDRKRNQKYDEKFGVESFNQFVLKFRT